MILTFDSDFFAFFLDIDVEVKKQFHVKFDVHVFFQRLWHLVFDKEKMLRPQLIFLQFVVDGVENVFLDVFDVSEKEVQDLEVVLSNDIIFEEHENRMPYQRGFIGVTEQVLGIRYQFSFELQKLVYLELLVVK